MTASEIHLTMTSGFATIAGSVLAAYIGFGVSTAPDRIRDESLNPACLDACRVFDHFGGNVDSSINRHIQNALPRGRRALDARQDHHRP